MLGAVGDYRTPASLQLAVQPVMHSQVLNSEIRYGVEFMLTGFQHKVPVDSAEALKVL